ncbi:MAG TPA: enterotoxin [Candidatus Limnocylindrales bacterium]|nr:enterotoxin [Candidatus Limnocylindrales bacterium]
MRSRTAVLLLAGFAAIVAATPLLAQETPVYFAPEPGAARVEASGSGFAISNAVVAASWRIADGKLAASEFRDLIDGRAIAGPANPFVLIIGSDRAVTPAEMEVTSGPKMEELAANADASRLSERVPGKAVLMQFRDAKESLDVTWRVILRDGSNYVRSEVTVAATDRDVPISEIRMIDWELPGAHVDGAVHGSPVVDGTIFVGFEHPLSECEVALERARCKLERELPLKKGHAVTYASVAGVTAPGQLRRGFLHYVERERAHPYRTFLHYNSWYDLGFFNRYDEAQALDVVRAFGTELVEKRGVKLSSFLFDDGWDNPSTLWQFNPGFPHGLTAVRAEAEKYGAEPGIWMSPWGGYSEPKRQRVAAARAGGYEIVDNGLALSGPKYYALFRDTCLRMIREYGVNQFKFDGTGNANRVFPGSQFDSDFDAAINLIGELRAEKRDLYVNLTTGTYPSPFWLMYADSIWRGGDDDDFLGVGTDRERWITYRDADTYEHVVMNGPLYPLNSLMLHGMIFARYEKHLNSDPGHDFKNEVRDYFGTGTQLQEMYITPSLLSPADWDTLAEAAKWSRENADILVDTHWIGGDPAQLEVYGWASWAPRKGILVLRNPSNQAQSISIDAAKAFELPVGAASEFQLRSPWKEDASLPAVTIRAGEAQEFELKPFEVKVLEATPVNH